ncbi:MAG: hypothetical protein M1331_01275 [Candidatus Marsarchaeota archaeon]|nr:hypothetical protein [Candidatus Marsarchaeota archaeon]
MDDNTNQGGQDNIQEGQNPPVEQGQQEAQGYTAAEAQEPQNEQQKRPAGSAGSGSKIKSLSIIAIIIIAIVGIAVVFTHPGIFKTPATTIPKNVVSTSSPASTTSLPSSTTTSVPATTTVTTTSTSTTTTTAPANTSTIPANATVYQSVYNGNFIEGYSGWNVSGKGFGTEPLNITHANTANVMCYLGTPWANYNSTFFATTYNCGLSNVNGNLTSSYFKVIKPFLNFRIISPQDKGLYVEILYNHKPYMIVHYNTYNNTLYTNSSSTFRNVTMPLEPILGRVVQVRVVAATLKQQTYIGVEGFGLSNTPHEDIGVIENITTNSTLIK